MTGYIPGTESFGKAKCSVEGTYCCTKSNLMQSNTTAPQGSDGILTFAVLWIGFYVHIISHMVRNIHIRCFDIILLHNAKHKQPLPANNMDRNYIRNIYTLLTPALYSSSSVEFRSTVYSDWSLGNSPTATSITKYYYLIEKLCHNYVLHKQIWWLIKCPERQRRFHEPHLQDMNRWSYSEEIYLLSHLFTP